MPQYAELSATASNAIISKTEVSFWIFFPILKCAWNLKHFEKNDECPSLIISEIIVFEKGCYWNVYKVLLQNTIG